MSGGQCHQIDEVENGPSHLVGQNHRRKIITPSKGTGAFALT
jgi:hypothetical protein